MKRASVPFVLVVLLSFAGPALAATPKVGDTVWAQWRPNSWYHGKVDKTCPLGLHIQFDDGDQACIHASMAAVDSAPKAADVKVGTRVLAKWTDGKYYPATVRGVGKTFDVQFDDRAKLGVPIDGLRLLSTAGAATSFAAGDVVWAQWKPNGWYHGKVATACDAGFHVKFDDGDEECIPPSLIAMDEGATTDAVKVGLRVIATWTDGRYYPGIVAKDLGSGSYQIAFDDGDKGAAKPGNMRILAK